MTTCSHSLTIVRQFGYPWQYDECLSCGLLYANDGGVWRPMIKIYQPTANTFVSAIVGRK